MRCRLNIADRRHRHNDHYWQVYFDTNRAIFDTFTAAGYPPPEQLVFMRSQAG